MLIEIQFNITCSKYAYICLPKQYFEQIFNNFFIFFCRTKLSSDNGFISINTDGRKQHRKSQSYRTITSQEIKHYSVKLKNKNNQGLETVVWNIKTPFRHNLRSR